MPTGSSIASIRAEPAAWTRRLALGFALAVAGCAAASEPPPAPMGVCDQLAAEFEQIAAERDRGVARDAQIDAARRAVAGGTTDTEGLLRSRLEAIDFVYRRPESDPAAVARFVRNNCIVGSSGRPLLYLPRSRTDEREDRRT